MDTSTDVLPKKMQLPCDPATPLLGIDPKKMKTGCQRGSCTPAFGAGLFTTSKVGEPPRCLWMDEWVREKQCTHTQRSTTAVGKKKSCRLWQRGRNVRVVCQGKEAGQRKTNTAQHQIKSPTMDTRIEKWLPGLRGQGK